jgi:hypothetical protein
VHLYMRDHDYEAVTNNGCLFSLNLYMRSVRRYGRSLQAVGRDDL